MNESNIDEERAKRGGTARIGVPGETDAVPGKIEGWSQILGMAALTDEAAKIVDTVRIGVR